MRSGLLSERPATAWDTTPARIGTMPAAPNGAAPAVDAGSGAVISPGAHTPTSLRRRSQARALKLFAPAIAGALAAYAVFGGPGEGLLIGLAILAGASLFRGFVYPLELVPASRVVVALVGPLVGVGTIAVLSQLGTDYVAAPIGNLVFVVLTAVGTALLADVAATHWVGRRPLRVAVMGSPSFAVGLQRELAENGIKHVEFVGWLNTGGELLGNDAPDAVQRLRTTVLENRIDLIVRGRETANGSAAHYGGSRPFERAAEACLDLPVRMIDGNQFYEDVFGHVPLGTIDSAWYLFLMHPRYRSTGVSTKRAMDLALATIVGLVALPLVAIAAALIKLEDRGPVFYRQRRVGEAGREFDILKLRTMGIDAERGGQRWSSAGDARVTRVGAILRRTHVDELSQVINVLRGEMTLVGPRPERPEIVEELEETFVHYQRRHLVKPGVTGWAQVRCGYAGSTLGTAWKLCHDLYYLKHRSVLADLLIMFETVVIAAKDAHRSMRAPASQFVFGAELGIDTSVDEALGAPHNVIDMPLPVVDVPAASQPLRERALAGVSA